MSSQIMIQGVLLLAIAAMGWMMLRSPGGARHQATRRLVTIAFVLFAVVAILAPRLVTEFANLLGVGRGTDLLLYALVLAFLAQVLSSFRRNAARERQITRLARRIALDEAPDPPTTDPPATAPTATNPPATAPSATAPSATAPQA